MRQKNLKKKRLSFDINKKSEILDIGSKVSDIKKIKGQFMGLIKTYPNGWRLMKKYINKLPKADIKKFLKLWNEGKTSIEIVDALSGKLQNKRK